MTSNDYVPAENAEKIRRLQEIENWIDNVRVHISSALNDIERAEDNIKDAKNFARNEAAPPKVQFEEALPKAKVRPSDLTLADIKAWYEQVNEEGFDDDCRWNEAEKFVAVALRNIIESNKLLKRCF